MHSPNLNRVADRPIVREESYVVQKCLPFPLLIIHRVQEDWPLPAAENTDRDLRVWPGQRNHLMENMEDKVTPTTSFTLLTLSI